ncbi:MAG TPA: FAD-dependent oxidoreductase [Steroidobacter sp.]|uniref:FAD-dependent oxidoreductase n=1 Tax=Steroidobacter sp. TaxID=1978227 RepID=UPI002ED7E9CC
MKISRRDTLKGLAAATAVGGLAACGRSTSPPAQTSRNDFYDVVVVGGGFAGVTAARDLSFRGRRTLLLEARPRLGGRTFTSEFAGHRVDLGGTWIGVEQPFVWAERMRYGIGLAESAAFAQPQQGIYLAGGKRHQVTPEKYAELFASGARKFLAPAQEAFPRPFDPFFSKAYERFDHLSSAQALEALKLSQPERDIVSGFAAINGHSHLAEIGYLDQLKWCALGAYDPLRLFENCARYRLEGGTGSLLDAMSNDSRAEVRLSSPVTAIVRENDTYRVEIEEGGSVGTRAVLLAVPLNVLASLRFEPGISAEKMAASRERITGSGTKLYARLKGTQPVFSAQGPDKTPLTFLWSEYVDEDSQIAVGFGPDPKLLDVNDTEAVQKAVAAFVPGAEVLESTGYDWNVDPYSQGTWCMYRPMFFSKYLRELQRPEGGLYFAGSDIANGWRGFIDGAIESGMSAARQIHSALNS